MLLKQPPSGIGVSAPRTDAMAKATGTEKYASDHYMENMLWAGVKRAGVPHGRIGSVDVSAANGLDGVFAVLTAKDVPGTNRQGITHKDQPVIAEDKVRCVADPVVLVIAETREALAEALSLISVDIEPLPLVLSPQQAMAQGAPLVHDRESNVLKHVVVRKGDAEAALAQCDVVVDFEYATPVQDHAFLETQNGLAWQESDGALTMVVSTQAPFRDRFEIGHALGLNPGRIRVQAPYMGGGFGGKDGATVQCLLALAALHSHGRPVKMWWSREESFIGGTTRHAATMRYRLGANRDGALQALTCRVDYDTGAYAHLGVEVMALGLEHATGPYRVAHTRLEGNCVYTNNVTAGAMRAFGVCQVAAGIEQAMDLLADKLGMDPLELRQKNALHRGDVNAVGVTMTHSTGIAACLDTVAGDAAWQGRRQWKQKAGPDVFRGVGVAAVFNAMGYGRGLSDAAVAKVRLSETGDFIIYSGVADMGQGNAAAYAQIACEVLCQENASVRVVQPDTAQGNPSGSSSAGRTTYTYGKALVHACREMARRLISRAAMALMVDDEREMALLPGRIRHLPTGREMPLSAVAPILHPDDRTCIHQFQMPVALDTVEGGNPFGIGFPHLLFSFAAHAAWVEVSRITGHVRVVDYLAATDGGRVLNPQNFDQQVHGAVAQGLGYALFEDPMPENGMFRAHDFSTYILPTAMDVPPIRSVALETDESSGPFGMKGIGEVGMNGPLPAVANAIADACGIRIPSAPLTAEKVLLAMVGTQSLQARK